MKIQTCVLWAGMTLSAFVHAEQVEYDLQKVRSLIEQKEYAQAFALQQKYFDVSRDADDQFGVRLSFALGDWAELAEVYPPAMEALRNRIEEHESTLLSGSGDFDTMMEYSAFNELLGEQGATVEVFRAIDERYPEQADSLYIAVKDELFAQQEYQLIYKYLTDPIYAYEQARHRRELDLSHVRTGRIKGDRFHTDKSYSQSVYELLQMAESLGLIEEYNEIKKRHKAYVDLYQKP
ncbi:hypothetical protein [Gilvimarinus chinensis]|uniref:hypothetical protein n=1 Tax=Gilvimarinus chinensis TaxID=396005 RepID=UPI00037B61AE|nr:hypothetical protein [Gilvimarinus chinensis]